MHLTKIFGRTAFVISWMIAASTFAGDDHDHEGDIVVGRTAANQLAVEFDFTESIELPPVDGLLTGWAGNEPGLTALDADEPAEDFFTLGTEANILFELLSIDPAFTVFSPGLIDVLDTPGDRFVIGMGDFDEHATFFIDADDPAFDPGAGSYELTFRLLDTGSTDYTPSQPLSATYVGIPEPTTALLLGAGLVCAGAQASSRKPRKDRK